MALLKLGDWDPDVFYKFRDTILNQVAYLFVHIHVKDRFYLRGFQYLMISHSSCGIMLCCTMQLLIDHSLQLTFYSTVRVNLQGALSPFTLRVGELSN